MDAPPQGWRRKQQGTRGLTITELLLTLFLIATLTTLLVLGVRMSIVKARQIHSTRNLRAIAVANVSYAADHDGYYCPAQNRLNNMRWHGSRRGSSGRFDPNSGYLSPYLGASERMESCPMFTAARDFTQTGSFEENSGGYGYNAAYIGGTPGKPFQPNHTNSVPSPGRTVMFTTTALSKQAGLQEYPFSEPFFSVLRNGMLGQPLQPSTHFRFNGRALVAWCDGRVTAQEKSRSDSGRNFYGGDNEKANIGWFGPSAENGYWNPDSTIVATTDPDAWSRQSIRGAKSAGARAESVEGAETKGAHTESLEGAEIKGAQTETPASLESQGAHAESFGGGMSPDGDEDDDSIQGVDSKSLPKSAAEPKS